MNISKKHFRAQFEKSCVYQVGCPKLFFYKQLNKNKKMYPRVLFYHNFFLSFPFSF